MTEKRFTINFDKRVIVDAKKNAEYRFLVELKTILNELNDENKRLKSENQMLNQRLIELDDLKWIREHTVWGQMPTRTKTYTKTSLNGDGDD